MVIEGAETERRERTPRRTEPSVTEGLMNYFTSLPLSFFLSMSAIQVYSGLISAYTRGLIDGGTKRNANCKIRHFLRNLSFKMIVTLRLVFLINCNAKKPFVLSLRIRH